MSVYSLVNSVDAVRSDIRHLLKAELRKNPTCCVLQVVASQLPSVENLTRQHPSDQELMRALQHILQKELDNYTGAALPGEIPYKQHYFVEQHPSGGVLIIVLLVRHGMFASIVDIIAERIRRTVHRMDVGEPCTVTLPLLRVYGAYQPAAALESAINQGKRRLIQMLENERIWIDPEDHGEPYVFICKRV